MLKNNHPGKKNTPLTQPEQQNKKLRKFRLDAKEIIGLISLSIPPVLHCIYHNPVHKRA